MKMVVHILSVVFTGFMIWLSPPGTDLFSWHPICMTIAFILLLLQAIVIFSPESSLFPNSGKSEKVQLHWIIHLFGLASIAFGFGAVYLNKEINGRKHFTSWHGKFGLASVVGVCLALVGGVMANYSLSLKKWIKPINMKMYHATAGMLVYLLSMVSVALGMYSNWFTNRVEGWLWRICLWVPLILSVCVARQVTQSFLPRVLVPKESQHDAKAREVQAKIEAKLRRQKEKKSGQKQQSSSNDEETHSSDEKVKSI